MTRAGRKKDAALAWCPIRGVRARVMFVDDITIERVQCTWCGRMLQPKQRLPGQIEVPIHKMPKHDRL